MYIRRTTPIVQPHPLTRNLQRFPEAWQESADLIVNSRRVDVPSMAGGAKFNTDIHDERIDRRVIVIPFG